MIIAKNITKHFDGIAAVKNVSIHCKNGSITGLIGPNGSGKSTLINVLTGILKKEKGTITLDDTLSRTFQDSKVWDNLTVLDTMLLATETRSPIFSLVSMRKNRDDIHELLRRVDLTHHTHAHTKNLSYGQRKLLEIARALATKSTTLFLDEPFAGLSPSMVENVKTILQEEKAKGKAVILVEHDMSVIRELADYAYVLDSGELIAEGEVEDVLAKKEVIAAYLGD
jgi:branched-chain amino acid transport system ATP-binding protein